MLFIFFQVSKTGLYQTKLKLQVNMMNSRLIPEQA